MILDEVMADVMSQLNDQARLGVQVERATDVPQEGPVHRGVWIQIRGVTAVFADLKNSTGLNADNDASSAAHAYTYFIRAMTVILERFDVKYIDIQGDGIFGLFSGRESEFLAIAAAITMITSVERDLAVRFSRNTSTNWNLTAGIGIDRGTLLVRRLGLRGTKQNEVWAGKPVNTAAKLSSLAGPNQILVSQRMFNIYNSSSGTRRQILFESCGCNRSNRRRWVPITVPNVLSLDFNNAHRFSLPWCERHGSEHCETLITGRRPR